MCVCVCARARENDDIRETQNAHSQANLHGKTLRMLTSEIFVNIFLLTVKTCADSSVPFGLCVHNTH